MPGVLRQPVGAVMVTLFGWFLAWIIAAVLFSWFLGAKSHGLECACGALSNPDDPCGMCPECRSRAAIATGACRLCAEHLAVDDGLCGECADLFHIDHRRDS